MSTMRIVVVGGGVAGLVAAYGARSRGADVLLVERSPELGGKLRAAPMPFGDPVEAGAEAFAVRDPQTGAPSAAAELVSELGLDADLVRPGVSRAAVVDPAGGLVPIPAATLFGIPSNVDGERGPTDRPLLTDGADTAVGTLVRARLGDDLVDRLVDPMLGGVYAGRADDLSLAATIPALATACRAHTTLTGAVRAVLAARPASDVPLFATLRTGLTELSRRLAAAIGPRRIRAGLPVRRIRRRGDRDGSPAEGHPAGHGWEVFVGTATSPEVIAADGVILALPGRPAGRLLSEVDTSAAGLVGALDYASVALVTLVLPETDLPEISGFLVPAGAGSTIKAATFVDRKWPHLRRPGHTLIRVSVGRYGDEAVLRRSDRELVDVAVRELADILADAPGSARPGTRSLPAMPVHAAVHRWGGALPQYTPGHVERTAAARAVLPDTVGLAGAAYDGVGIPACVRSGRAAAERVLTALEQSTA